MRERSRQATPQFRKEKTVRGDQAQGTREFRKSELFNVAGLTNMTEKIVRSQ